MTLVLVAVAYRLDLLIGASYIRDTVTIAFVASEGISTLENAGLSYGIANTRCVD